LPEEKLNVMSPVRINEDNIFTVLTAGNWVLLTLLTLTSLYFSLRFAGSVFVGGILAIANFYWLLSVLKRVLNLPIDKAGRFAQVRYVLRLSVLALILWIMIRFVGIDVMGLLLGLSIIVINIITLALYTVARKGG
jgi:hypothetical protein